MNILQISHKPPYPTVDGGCLAMADLANILTDGGHTVSLFTLNSPKHPFQPASFPKDMYQEIWACQILSEPSLWGGIRSLLRQENYISQRFLDLNSAEKLVKMLSGNHFDAVILESAYCGVYLPTVRAHSGAKVMLRSHNIEHHLWEKRLSKSSCIEKSMMRSWVSEFGNEEKTLWSSVDAVLSISSDELQEIGYFSDKRVLYLPTSVQTIHAPSNQLGAFYFLGAMDWEPNKQAIQWFISEVWPSFRKLHPEQELHIAGKGLKTSEYARVDGVLNHGFVPSASDFLVGKGILINPLRTAQGIRIKALEAVSQGKVIISTYNGMEGLPFLPNVHYLLAESIEDFIRQMEFALQNPEEIKAMIIKAQAVLEEYFSSHKLVAKINTILEQVNEL